MFDYDLAPYVAKSFVRNVINYIEIKYPEIPTTEYKRIIKQADEYIKNHRGIMDETGICFLTTILMSLLSIQNAGYNYTKYHETTTSGFEYAKKKTKRDCEQAMEALVHNLNTLQSRSGGQVPFSSVNFGTDTSTEGRMVSAALLWATDQGLGNGETAIFPISIFKMKKGINQKGDPNYDLFQEACRVSAKRMFPNFLNENASFNEPYYKEGKPETEVSSIN